MVILMKLLAELSHLDNNNHDNNINRQKTPPLSSASERNLRGVNGVNDAPEVLHWGILLNQLNVCLHARGQTARRNLEVYKHELLWGSSLNLGFQLEILYKTLSSGSVQGSRAEVLYIHLYFLWISYFRFTQTKKIK